MSYEVEAIVNPNAAPNVSQAPVMREPREIDPYQVRAYKPNQAKQDADPIGQPDKVESAPVEPKVSEETVKLSAEMAAKAKREQMFRQQQQALQKDRAALVAEKEELAQLRAMKDKLAAKDYSGLDGLVDYNEYSQYQVNKINSTDPREEEFRKLSTKIESIEKTTQENLEKQYQAAIEERRIAAEQFLTSASPEVFSRVKDISSKNEKKIEEAVVHHILDVWENDNEEISVEEAMKNVQQDLSERVVSWGSYMSPTEMVEVVKKWPQERVSQLMNQLSQFGKPARPEDTRAPLPPMKQGLRTLTNQVTAGDGKGPRKPLYQIMNDQDRWEEARRRAEERLQTAKP